MTSLNSKLVRATVIAACVAMLQGAVCAQSVIRTASLSPGPAPHEPIGVWSGNSLLNIEAHWSGAPLLHIYDDSGTEIERVVVQAFGARSLQVMDHNFARSPDGYVAVTGLALGGSDRGAHFLAVISPDGASQTVVRTDPYAPHAVAFAADGTIWMAGCETNEAGDDKGAGQSYFMIRHVDKTGKPLGGAVPRTEFAGQETPLAGSSFVASKDRVGWFSPRANRYMEFSLDGKELGTYPFPVSLRNLGGVALCEDNSVWVSAKTDPLSTALSVLDRAHGSWISGKPQQPFVYLYGCSGTTLVTTSNWTDLDWRAAR